MAIAMAETSYTDDLSILAHFADSQSYERAFKLKNEIIDKVEREIESKRLKEQDKLVRIFMAAYENDFSRFKSDVSKVALLNLESTEGLNMAQRFLYGFWQEFGEDFNIEFFEQRWMKNDIFND